MKNCNNIDYFVVEAHKTKNGRPEDLMQIIISKGYDVH